VPKYRKRKDGRYGTYVTIGYDDEGKRIRRPVYGSTIKELEAKLADFRSLQNKGVVISDNKTTLAEWAVKWLAAYKQGVSYNTYEMYRSCVENHIVKSDVAKLSLIKIKNSDLQKLINEKQADGLTRTVDIIVLSLKQIFNKAIKNNMLYINPADDLSKPANKAKQKRALTDTENKTIEKASLSDKQRAFVYLGKYAGLRRGEILALTKGDFDLKERTITINKTVIFKVNEGEIKSFETAEKIV